MMFKTRPMRLNDLQVVYDTQCAGFSEDLWEPLEMFEKIFTRYPQGCFVAENNSVVIGYSIVQPADENRSDFDSGFWEIRGDEECLYLHDMCISPEGRGQGLVQGLLSAVEEFGRAHSFKKIVGISVQNTQKFWTKMGFSMGRDYTYLDQAGTFITKDL